MGLLVSALAAAVGRAPCLRRLAGRCSFSRPVFPRLLARWLAAAASAYPVHALTLLAPLLISARQNHKPYRPSRPPARSPAAMLRRAALPALRAGQGRHPVVFLDAKSVPSLVG